MKRIKTLLSTFHLSNSLLIWILKNSNEKYFFSSIKPDSKYFEEIRYWRGPVWINCNWILYKGLLEKEKELGSNIKFEDIMDEVAGVYPKVMLDGEMEAGAWSCGMVVGLINDIPSCKELIDGIMSEADSLITKRLEGMLSA